MLIIIYTHHTKRSLAASIIPPFTHHIQQSLAASIIALTHHGEQSLIGGVTFSLIALVLTLSPIGGITLS